MEYYAHSTKNRDKSDWHLLKRPLNSRCGSRLENLPIPSKERHLPTLPVCFTTSANIRVEFQKRLEGDQHKVTHSTAGAIEGRME